MSDTAKRILLFVGLTLALSFALAFLMGQAAAAIVLYVPLAAMIITRIATGEGFEDVWLRPRFRQNLRYYIGAWIVPILLLLAGAVLYFLLFPAKFDNNLGYMAELYKAQNIETDAAMLQSVMSQQLIVALIVSPLINTLSFLCEEWGWRGYLLPKLSEIMKPVWAVLLCGLLSGVAYLPLVYLGYNYGVAYAGFPYIGMLAMCVYSVVTGVLFAYVTYRTRTFLPAALARGAMASFASIGFYYLHSSAEIEPLIGPAPTGVVGGVPFVIAAIVIAVFILRKTKDGTLIRPYEEAK